MGKLPLTLMCIEFPSILTSTSRLFEPWLFETTFCDFQDFEDFEEFEEFEEFEKNFNLYSKITIFVFSIKNKY